MDLFAISTVCSMLHIWVITKHDLPVLPTTQFFLAEPVGPTWALSPVNNCSITENSHCNQVFSDPGVPEEDTQYEAARQTYLSQRNMVVCCILLCSLGSNWGHIGGLEQCCQWDNAPHGHGSRRCRNVNTEVIQRGCTYCTKNNNTQNSWSLKINILPQIFLVKAGFANSFWFRVKSFKISTSDSTQWNRFEVVELF